MAITIYQGDISFENYWGESLKMIYIEHHLADIHNSLGSKRLLRNRFYHDIPDKTKIDNVMWFSYELDTMESYNHWYVYIITENGKRYRSKSNFYCSITRADEGKVILGVNGESERLYVHYPASSGCSVKMEKDILSI
ncbi:TPA: hypothetical protein ACS7XC_001318 [Providencia alcalifaciens]